MKSTLSILSLLVFFSISLALDPDYEDLDPNWKENEYKKCDAKCVFRPEKLNTTTVASFPKNCAKVCSILQIDHTSGLTMQQLTNTLKNMKTLVGELKVFDTTFKDASFLGGLQRMESSVTGILIIDNKEMLELGWKNFTTLSALAFNVYGNDKLKKLNMPKWKNVTCTGKCEIWTTLKSGYESNFCLDTQQIKLITLNKKVTFLDIDAKICKPAKTTKKLCTVPTVGCEELVGDLKIGAKFDVKKVKSLKILFGSLLMNSTVFADFKMFSNLTHIIQTNNNERAIDVQNNKNLKSIKFPKLNGENKVITVKKYIF